MEFQWQWAFGCPSPCCCWRARWECGIYLSLLSTNSFILDLMINDIGAVISLGGCTDQTVHSDTAHPFTCCHELPAHYVNLFLIAPDSSATQNQVAPTDKAVPSCLCCDFRCCFDIYKCSIALTWRFPIAFDRVGQTAFIAGSHRLQVSSLCMNGGDAGKFLLCLA